MSFEKFLFYAFSAVLIFAAVMVITRRNPVHSALYLVLAFFSSAGIWLLAEAEFLAIVLVLVYVGAVMVLFLFVVMMLDIDVAAMRAGFIKWLPVGVLVGLLIAGEIFMVVGPGTFGLDQYAAPEPLPADARNTAVLGGLLYTVYMYPFEIAAVILLVAIIAAIGLTHRRRTDATKYIDVSKQVRVRKGEDRVKLVDVPTEEKMELK
jgi:NADH-quinone oxidoreductase subunit J